MLTRYAKLRSQLFIENQATGKATSEGCYYYSLTKSTAISITSCKTSAPSTFLIPISLAL